MDNRRKIEAIAAARREIARRIARFCTSLTPEEFDRLLDRMASVQWKYDVLPVVAESHPPIEQILNRGLAPDARNTDLGIQGVEANFDLKKNRSGS